MATYTAPIRDALMSHAGNTGYFSSVNGHDIVHAQQSGISASLMYSRQYPTSARSGLNITSMVLVFIMRISVNGIAEPRDFIDLQLLDAQDALMAAYSDDFSLGYTGATIDLLGMTGVDLRADAGYTTPDKVIMRSVDITIPVIIDDVWGQRA